MRTILIAGTALAALLGTGNAAASERVVQRGPGVIHAAPGPGMHPSMGMQHRGPRWGSKVGGRWWGGVNAPGGWSAYRRPVRGWAVPVYWNTPRFYISDWSTYGLSQPQPGYNWVRYYDDAVLVDSRGSVFDTANDVDWDGYDAGPDDRDDYRDDGLYAREDARRDGRDDGYARRDNGLGGAAIGAVAGGVAGNVIAGRGNRLGGTLIGAGVGAAAGYAIDKAEDRGRGAPPPPPPYSGHHGRYGVPYQQPGYGADYPPPYRSGPMHGGDHWVSPDGGTTVVTTGGGYGGSVTTVTVQSAPVVTTTTTEIYEDHVTWSRPAVRRKVWKPRRKATCYCR